MTNEGPRPTRVLIVEDDVDTLVAFGRALTAFGLDGIPVTSCAHARAALATIGNLDVAVADLELPDGDGVSLLREIRQTCPCATAVMSGHPKPATGLPDGVDLWLHKPVDLVQLRNAVQTLATR